MAARKIELIIYDFCDNEICSAAVVVKAIADVCELLKCEGRIVLKPTLDVLVRREVYLGAFGLVVRPKPDRIVILQWIAGERENDLFCHE